MPCQECLLDKNASSRQWAEADGWLVSAGSQALAIEVLTLRSCQLGDRGTQSLLSLLADWCPYLTDLDIGRNNLGQGMSGGAALALEEILIEESVPIST